MLNKCSLFVYLYFILSLFGIFIAFTLLFVLFEWFDESTNSFHGHGHIHKHLTPEWTKKFIQFNWNTNGGGICIWMVIVAHSKLERIAAKSVGRLNANFIASFIFWIGPKCISLHCICVVVVYIRLCVPSFKWIEWIHL